MAKTITILEIDMHTDTETGLHAVGEMDFSVPTTTHEWFDSDPRPPERRKRVADWMRRVADGIEHEGWFSLKDAARLKGDDSEASKEGGDRGE